MDIFEPGATLMGGKYRLERLLVAHEAVTVWEATDMHSGRCVRLSVFEHGSSMLDHGRIDRGMFVVFDAPPRPASGFPRLELVEISDEDAFFDEPPPPELFDVPMSSPKRGWLWGAALVACLVVGVGGLYVSRARPVATSAVTLNEAPIPVPQIATPQPTAPPSSVPTAEPEHREVPAPSASAPAPKRPKPVRPAPRPKLKPPPPPPPPPEMTSDPVTL